MRRFAALIALVTAIMLLALTSCKKQCTSHTDADKNGRCDTCEAAVDINCTDHTDADKNGKCDTCGVTVEQNGGSGDSTGDDPVGDTPGGDEKPGKDDTGNEEKPGGDIDLPIDPFI